MSNKLSDILLEIEIKKFEISLWELAIDTYTIGKNNPDILENVNTILNKKLTEYKSADIFLEQLNVDNIIEIMNENILDDFKIVVADKWEILKRFWNETLITFVKIADSLHIEFIELKTLLMNKSFYEAFKRLSKDLILGLKKMADVWADTFADAQNFIFKNIKASMIGKNMDEFAGFIDGKLNGPDAVIWQKAIRVILGGAVVWISYEIWTKMFFIGDWRYDFDYSAAIGTMLGTVDFKSVLGAEFIPTLFWFISGAIEKSLNLVIPCPPSCNWFGNNNIIATVFVTGYILATNGSLKDIKESKLGKKIQNYLIKIPKSNVSRTNTNLKTLNINNISVKSGLLKPI